MLHLADYRNEGESAADRKADDAADKRLFRKLHTRYFWEFVQLLHGSAAGADKRLAAIHRIPGENIRHFYFQDDISTKQGDTEQD